MALARSSRPEKRCHLNHTHLTANAADMARYNQRALVTLTTTTTNNSNYY